MALTSPLVTLASSPSGVAETTVVTLDGAVVGAGKTLVVVWSRAGFASTAADATVGVAAVSAPVVMALTESVVVAVGVVGAVMTSALTEAEALFVSITVNTTGTAATSGV